MDNNIFNSNYSTSNPFTMSRTNPLTSEDSFTKAYQQLEAIKQKQAQIDAISKQPLQQQIRNVFVDIADEMKDLPEDEISYITNSPEYIKLNVKYQNEFSQFLISKFSAEYLQTGNQRTLEEMLAVIKDKKAKYKEKFASEIKDLADKNSELEAVNADLQRQLKEIQSQLIKE